MVKKAEKSSALEKDIHSKLSKIELKLDKLVAEVATITQSISKVPESTDCKSDKEGDAAGKTPYRNRSYSPFLSPDGEMMVSSRVSTTKRKLDVNGTGEKVEVEEKHFAGYDVDSFDIRNIRFTEPQFPPGLETLKDLIEDEEIIKDKKKTEKVKSPDIKVKTPKSKEITTPDNVESESNSEKRPLRRLRQRQLSQIIDSTVILEEVPSSSSKPKKEKKSNAKAKGAKQPVHSKAVTRSAENENQTISEMAKSSKSRRLRKRTSEAITEEGQRTAIEVHSGDDNGGVLQLQEECLQQPLYLNYVSQLSPLEKQICIQVEKAKESDTLYCTKDESLIRLSVGESWCLYPDMWLSNQLINVYLYDMLLGLNDKTMLILPASFQTLVLKSDPRCEHYITPSILNYCSKIYEAFLKLVDLNKVEQIFIPVREAHANHWFLLVYHVSITKVYIVDSLEMTVERNRLAMDMINFAAITMRRNPLGRFFKNSKSIVFEVLDNQKQPNGHDCGMYILKYIECGDIRAMKDITYTTTYMRVERLKYLAKLLLSEHNIESTIKSLIGQS